MKLPKDITGVRSYKLVAIKCVGKDSGYSFLWECKCDCGNSVILRPIRITGKTAKSCGCIKFTKHGMTKTNFYVLWQGIKKRCLNPNNKDYKHYGGRGIKLCKRWMEFINFRSDMYESYQNHLEKYGRINTTIERLNNDGNYSPKNCTWATRKQQEHNKRNKH